MAFLIVTGTQCMCSMGAAPGVFMATPDKMSMGENKPAANIIDNKPVANIPVFGVCRSLANPQVAAATAAALGVLTPMPCMPVIAAPWTPGSPTVQIKNMPALTNTSKTMCNWGGIIQFITPGAATIQVA